MKRDQHPRRRPIIAIVGTACLVLALDNPSARASPPLKPPTVSRPADLSNKQIVARATAALVSVEAQSADGTLVGRGSGFFFGKSNRVLTNLHVLKWAHRLIVKRLADQVRYQVREVAGLDPARDICLLVVDSPPVSGLSPARRGAFEVGDSVIVAGSPKGLDGTFTQGIISAIRSELDRVQIDAPISPGSSGGPVLNKRAEVIGIATSSLESGQQLNFAVPITGGLAMRELAWNVYAAASLAVRDVELHGLRGRPRQVEAREADITSVDPITGRRVEGSPDFRETTAYDESGMVTMRADVSHGTRSFEERFEYWEAPVLRRRITVFNTAVRWRSAENTTAPQGGVEEFAWLEGAKRRSNDVHFAETVVDGDQHGPARRLRGESTAYDSTSYDNNGRSVARERYGVSGKLENFRSTRAYDENGWERELRYFSIDGKLLHTFTYTYELDNRGNWVTQVTWVVDGDSQTAPSPLTATHRVISYY